MDDMRTLSMQETRGLENREILVVEPDDDERTRLSRLIHRAGARVTTAANGYEAIHLACLGVYEVVVTFADIPDMDGESFVQSVRSLAPGTRTVLVVDGSTGPHASALAPVPGRMTCRRDQVLEVIQAALAGAGMSTP
jgi:CheY-like chemotaxis protein